MSFTEIRLKEVTTIIGQGIARAVRNNNKLVISREY